MLKYLFLLLLSFPIFSQKIILNEISSKNITSEIAILPNSDANFEEVKKQPFKNNDKNTIIDISSKKPFWIKVSLENKTKNQSEWILDCHDRGMENLDFYVPNDSGEFSIEKYGMFVRKNTDWFVDEPAFVKIKVNPQASKTIYIKLYGARSYFHEVWISTPEEFAKKNQRTIFQNSFLWGILFLRLLYILILAFFAVKEPIFRAYGFHVFITILTILGLYHTLGRLFTENLKTAVCINYLGVHFVTLSQVFFTFFAIPLHRFPKIIKYILLVSITLNLLIAIFIIIDNQWYWVNASIYLSVYSAIFVVLLFVYSFVKKFEVNWYYGIAFLLGLGGFLSTRMMTIGWFGGEVAILAAIAALLFVADNFFFAFFLGKIIKNYERSKIDSEKELMYNKYLSVQLKELDTLKTRFFTNISHEFRTPLTLLAGPIEDLKNKYPNEGIITVMQRNLQRLQNLINQLLDLSKLDAGETKINKQEVDFSQFFAQTFASFESLAQSKNIIFNHSQIHSQNLGLFDLDKLEKIITNLLSNAFKFTPENGRISVRIEYINNKINLKIQDTGIGIEEKRLAHIFDRFYQVDDSNQRLQTGTGIGLALVKELVELLKGKIEVESELGKGTTFTLVLPFEPLAELSSPTIQVHRKSYLAETWTEPKNIETFKVENEAQNIMLIVEDNPDLRNYIASIFENQYQLITAVDGEDGLEKAIKFIPNIVISDLMMPKLDGLGFCEKLKNDERINHIPVVMLTAKASLSDRLSGLEHGADDYLSKPFNKEELQVRVSNLISQRTLMRVKYSTQNIVLQEKTTEKEPSIDDLFIQKSKQIIDKYIDKSEFDVEKFADEMNLSTVQLRRKLKAITDQTVTEFVRNYRLEMAADLLKKGNLSVSEIAYKVGFESMSYFSKVFQEKYGKVPSEWK